MVQQTISNAAIDAGVPIADALKNMNAWVTGFTTFPFPFFTFTSQQDDVYQKADFSLKADPDVVEKIVNIKNVAGLKDAVIGALKNSGGEIARYSKEERDFNYFGVITGYNQTNISTRVIKYALHMKNTDAKALCVTYASTELNSSYNTYEFVGDKYMMIKMQEAIQDKLVDKIAEKLLIFIDEFYSKQRPNVKAKIVRTILLIEKLKIVPIKFLKHLTGTKGLYEIRIKSGTDIFRIFCFFYGTELLILVNGFQKKTQKTPRNEINKALQIKYNYENEK